MTFDTDERSTAASRPIDLYTIVTPSAIYRLTSHPVDYTITSVTFTATTMDRGDQHVAQDLTGREVTIALPIFHPIIQRFAATGIPEREVIVEILRVQEVSGTAERQWLGFANGLSIEGRFGVLRVPSLTDDALKVRLPLVRGQRPCNHVLYDARCTVIRSTATNLAQITDITGNTVTTTSTSAAPHYKFGDIIHQASGERRMVIDQSGFVLTLNIRFVGAQVGDYVEIAPGCDHTIETCRDKFNKVINYGGHPNMNSITLPWALKGLGIFQ